MAAVSKDGEFRSRIKSAHISWKQRTSKRVTPEFNRLYIRLTHKARHEAVQRTHHTTFHIMHNFQKLPKYFTERNTKKPQISTAYKVGKKSHQLQHLPKILLFFHISPNIRNIRK